jgi:hypothetical protein
VRRSEAADFESLVLWLFTLLVPIRRFIRGWSAPDRLSPLPLRAKRGIERTRVGRIHQKGEGGLAGDFVSSTTAWPASGEGLPRRSAKGPSLLRARLNRLADAQRSTRAQKVPSRQPSDRSIEAHETASLAQDLRFPDQERPL